MGRGVRGWLAEEERNREEKKGKAGWRGGRFLSWIFRGKVGWRGGVGAGFLERKLRRGQKIFRGKNRGNEEKGEV